MHLLRFTNRFTDLFMYLFIYLLLKGLLIYIKLATREHNDLMHVTHVEIIYLLQKLHIHRYLLQYLCTHFFPGSTKVCTIFPLLSAALVLQKRGGGGGGTPRNPLPQDPPLTLRNSSLLLSWTDMDTTSV